MWYVWHRCILCVLYVKCECSVYVCVWCISGVCMVYVLYGCALSGVCRCLVYVCCVWCIGAVSAVYVLCRVCICSLCCWCVMEVFQCPLFLWCLWGMPLYVVYAGVRVACVCDSTANFQCTDHSTLSSNCTRAGGPSFGGHIRQELCSLSTETKWELTKILG